MYIMVLARVTDSSYGAVIDNLQADSGKVIGYVYTSYGTRALSSVESDIDAWYTFYPSMNGIFLDEQTNVTGKESYYGQIYNYVKQKDSSSLVVTNPGTSTLESYLFYGGKRIADVICTFETNQGFNMWTPSSWCSKYSRDNFYVIPYNIPSSQWLSTINRAASLNVGWVYLTDATLPNPYNGLPSYFEDYCDYLLNSIAPPPPPPPPPDSGGLINIDGHFNDWQGITPLNAPPNPSLGTSSDADADFTNIWAANDSGNLYLSYQVAGTIDVSDYFYHVFIDVDHDTVNNRTGFVYNDSASIGAEYMIENGSFYEYTGTGGADWSWASASGMQEADSAGRTELSIPLNLLFQSSSNNSAQLIFEVNLVASPYTMVDVAPGSYETRYYVYQIKNLTGIKRQEPAAPSAYSLSQNYPNPFNPTTTIQYTLPKESLTRIKVYNALGQVVSTIVNGIQYAGVHDARFDGANVSSGVYYYSIQAGNFFSAKKMLLLK